MISALFTIGTTAAMLWMSVRLARTERKLRESERTAAGLRARAFDEGYLCALADATGMSFSRRAADPSGDAGSPASEETRTAGGAR
jgi:hypothetical protein